MKKKIARRSNLLQFEEQKLELYKRNGNGDKHYEFQKWYMSKAKLFRNVDEDRSVQLAERIRAEVKACYHNCWRTVTDSTFKDLYYYEGLVWSNNIPIPLEHSWLVDKKGNVIDPTLAITGAELQRQLKKLKYLDKDNRRSDERRFGNEYLGIEFPVRQLNKFVLKQKATGTFLFELFKEESKIE